MSPLEQQAFAWRAVHDELAKINPGFVAKGETGQEGAIRFIRELGANYHNPAQMSTGNRGEWVMVPSRLHLDSADVQRLLNFAGATMEHGDEAPSLLLWVGNFEDDDGTQIHGLNVSDADYPEEGCMPLAGFAASLAPPPSTDSPTHHLTETTTMNETLLTTLRELEALHVEQNTGKSRMKTLRLVRAAIAALEAAGLAGGEVVEPVAQQKPFGWWNKKYHTFFRNLTPDEDSERTRHMVASGELMAVYATPTARPESAVPHMRETELVAMVTALGYNVTKAESAARQEAVGDKWGGMSPGLLYHREGLNTGPWSYRKQPGNVTCSAIGEACRRAADEPACGDYIDRGLILLRELQAKGYGVCALDEQPPKPHPSPAQSEGASEGGGATRSAWIVLDESGMPTFAAGWKEGAHDHIKDSIEAGNDEASKYVVREYVMKDICRD